MLPAGSQPREAQLPAFDAASIHPAVETTVGEASSRSRIESAADSLTMRNIDLEEMIEWGTIWTTFG